MARFKASLDTMCSPEATFAYLSDFSSTAEWDPNVVAAERLGDGPLGEGTEFRLVTSFAGHKSPITYRIVEYDPPHAVSFRGENATTLTLERITFEPAAGGTRIVYEANLTLRGVLKLAEPLLGLLLSRLGKRAIAGLRRTLEAGPV
jgi:uncharacterized protein YndB with AHSA1/START domain